MKKDKMPFDEAAETLGRDVVQMLRCVSDGIKCEAQEIRMRVGQPVCITTSDGQVFIDNTICEPEQIEGAFLELCSYSVYSCQNELISGFVTTRGGHRAGFGCSAVYKKGELTGIREITSINLRIAREAIGCADALCTMLFADSLCGVLLVGAPSSGKTTLLRDIARCLSDGGIEKKRKVVLVDERGELSAVNHGVPGMSVGMCCDILYGFEKSAAINQAVRCLSPEVIVCDEIGSPRDADALIGCVNAGVSVVASVHAANEVELRSRAHIVQLLKTGAFKKLVFLKGSHSPSQIAKVVNTDDILKTIGSCDDCYDWCNGRA